MRQSDTLESKAGAFQPFRKAAKQSDRPKKKYPAPLTYRPKDEAERQSVLNAARGMSVSEYIRRCVHGADVAPRKRKARIPARDEQSLAQVLARLGQSRMANNLNQIAYHANCGSLAMDEATVQQINEACAHIAWMRVKLIEALGLKDKGKDHNKGGRRS